MWIILVDHSSSMAQPFEASIEPARGPVRALQADVKIDAARKAVLLQLQRLDEETEVALFGFTDHARLIHTGIAKDLAGFESALQGLKPSGGTNIAAAIDQAIAYAEERKAAPGIQLITDGQSDLEAARDAARRAADARIAVNVFLIDPTDQGLDMAKAITRITNGQFEKVTSEEKLIEATSAVASAQAQAVEHAKELLAQEEAAFAAVASERAEAEEVEFTAGYPARIEPEKRYPLYAFVHLASMADEVGRQLEGLKQSLGPRPGSSSAASNARLLRGKLIAVQPSIEGIFANPPRQEIIWEDDIHRLDFQIRYNGKAGGPHVCSGFLNVLADGLIIGQVPISISVSGDTKPVVQSASGRLFSRVFASYAREDRSIVQACKEAYRALGIHLFVDTDDVLSGELWRMRITSEISKSEIFQLYWSTAAAGSSNVADEIATARDVAGQRAYIFIRPLYWEARMPKPPEGLSERNFTPLDLTRLQIRPETAAAAPHPQHREVPATFPILALDSNASAGTASAIQTAMSRVVPFLEALTELRYYPPITLLVDEYSIQSVRRELTVDHTGADDQGQPPTDVTWALDILRSLLLAFHVDKLHEGENDPWMDDDHVRMFYGLSHGEFLDYAHTKQQSEGGFVNAIQKYLSGKNPQIETRYAQPSSGFPVDSFLSYAKYFLALVTRYAEHAQQKRGDVSFRIGYGVPPEALDQLIKRGPGIRFQRKAQTRLFSDEPSGMYEWTLSLANYRAALAVATEAVLQATASVSGNLQPSTRYFVTTVPTYGIFAGASAHAVTSHLRRFAGSNGWPDAVSLPGTAKVLICADAMERYRKNLLDTGMTIEKAGQMAAWFMESTLVHEHFHGVLDSGIDRNGGRSAAENWTEWEKGMALNESLAVWAQRHYFRDNSAMFSNIDEYIRSGEYPEWPYRGAEAIEALLEREGLAAVRQLAAWLRRDPEAAQQAFDEDLRKRQAPIAGSASV